MAKLDRSLHYPELPSSLKGYTDVFREYAKALRSYYRRSFNHSGVVFDNSQGGLLHLFLIPDSELYYIRFMMACYWLTEHGHISRCGLQRLLGSSNRTVDTRIKDSKDNGHLTVIKSNYYELSDKGRRYVDQALKQYTDLFLELYELK